MAVVSMKALLETGVHFGHRTRKWNPKMRPYIFTERNGIHILDLQQTIKALEYTYDVVRDTVADGQLVLFVGTKRQAQETIAREAERCHMPYVNQRWLGGTLTNWSTIHQRIEHLDDLEERQARGEFELLSKKEALMVTRKIEKLRNRLGGIRTMNRLPGIIFLVDVVRESTAVHEANILDIPIVAMVDTNSDPDVIDYVIPSNDDAIRAIKLIASIMADAALEGLGLRKDLAEEEEEAAEVYEYDFTDYEEEEGVEDEAYLGEATLAKLRSGSLDFEDEEEEVAEKDEEPVEELAEKDEESVEELAEDLLEGEEEVEPEPEAEFDEERAEDDERDEGDEESPEDDERDEGDEESPEDSEESEAEG
jgi:small subunit ribosomal protein S2